MSDKVSNSVKKFRKEAGLTQEYFAEAMGVSRQTINSIERGKYIPSLPLALRIARFFKCSMDEMFSLEGVE